MTQTPFPSSAPTKQPPPASTGEARKPLLFIPKEIHPDETRVAASPESIERARKAGLDILVEAGAGVRAFIPDQAFLAAGATLAHDATDAYARADIVAKVRAPTRAFKDASHEASLLKPQSILLSFFVPNEERDAAKWLVDRKVSAFSMNLIPRITRAQKMDALSSQSNIAGYKAVLLAANTLPRFFPLLMTAAGTVKPAKVVVMGAGVAGLQAIATAKRLGAQVWASDVRLAAREQVESLGGRFIDVPGMEDLEDEKGYAKTATKEFLDRQQTIVGDHIADADVVITTALVPGRKAPRLISDELINRMRPGSVIVDLAAEQGGNCEGSVPGECIIRHEVRILGPKNAPGSVPFHASELYARNIAAFILPLIDDSGRLTLDMNDEILAASVLTHHGEIVNSALRDVLNS